MADRPVRDKQQNQDQTDENHQEHSDDDNHRGNIRKESASHVIHIEEEDYHSPEDGIPLSRDYRKLPGSEEPPFRGLYHFLDALKSVLDPNNNGHDASSSQSYSPSHDTHRLARPVASQVGSQAQQGGRPLHVASASSQVRTSSGSTLPQSSHGFRTRKSFHRVQVFAPPPPTPANLMALGPAGGRNRIRPLRSMPQLQETYDILEIEPVDQQDATQRTYHHIQGDHKLPTSLSFLQRSQLTPGSGPSRPESFDQSQNQRLTSRHNSQNSDVKKFISKSSSHLTRPPSSGPQLPTPPPHSTNQWVLTVVERQKINPALSLSGRNLIHADPPLNQYDSRAMKKDSKRALLRRAEASLDSLTAAKSVATISGVVRGSGNGQNLKSLSSAMAVFESDLKPRWRRAAGSALYRVREFFAAIGSLLLYCCVYVWGP